MNFASSTTKALLMAVTIGQIAGGISAAAQAAGSLAQKPAARHSTMTLDHLKNGSYQIPDLACGYRTIKLHNGTGSAGDIKAVFGRAIFGTLGSGNEVGAVVHLAYQTESLGWMQELVFISEHNSKLEQIAEYNLDDREELSGIALVRGEVVVESVLADPNAAKNRPTQKVTRIKVSQSEKGCMLQATEWQRDRATHTLKPYVDLAPYLSSIEDRVGRHWDPTQKDRGEHVRVTFKIKQSGAVTDLKLATSSAVDSADGSALAAVENAAPFPPLPAGSEQAIDVCFEFLAGVSVRSCSK